MKRNLLIFTFIFICGSLIAQIPESFKYQAVVRDGNGNILASTQVGLRISILQGSSSGTSVCLEEFSATTNDFGLVNLEIGSINTTDFSAIDWSAGPCFVKIELQVSGEMAFTEMGTSQLLSVPYSLHALTVENVNYTETDPVFNSSVSSGITENDTSYWNDKSDFDGDYNTLSNAPANLSDFTNDSGFITSPDDADADPVNELQLLSISNDTIYLSDGDFVKLPDGFDGDFNSLTNVPVDLDMDATDDFDGDYNNLANKPSIPANTSDLNNDSGFIISADDADADSTNELQLLSISNDTIYLSDGDFVKLPDGFDGDFNSLTNIPVDLDTDATDDFDGDYNNLANKPSIPANTSDLNNDSGFIISADDAEMQILLMNYSC